MQGLDSFLHGEGVVCSGNTCAEGGSSGTVGLGTCVWGMWEGRDALTCFLGEVELNCTGCGRVAGLHMGIVECRRSGLGLGMI